MECKDIEWAAFLFNAIGEDRSYIIKLNNIQKGIKGKQKLDKDVVNEIVDFLNEWGSRAKKDGVCKSDKASQEEGQEEESRAKKDGVCKIIKEWYNESSDQLAALPSSLADLNDNNAEIIKEVYRTLGKNHGIGDTIDSKVLHIIKPDLFVPWDIPIKTWYDFQLKHEGDKTMSQEEKYLTFLKKMQKEAESLLQQNSNFLSELNSNVKKLYEGNLEQAKNSEPQLKGPQKKSMKIKIDNYTEMVDFMKNKGKTITKYLDEYNWVTITNAVKIKPEWHPD